ncbi:MAG: hypothetical protein M1813_004440 [Trichoglossum hirsutum]|nr:MAG: hypothetical protein M1813_004440 [Trichoglossum hirsutum]
MPDATSHHRLALPKWEEAKERLNEWTSWYLAPRYHDQAQATTPAQSLTRLCLATDALSNLETNSTEGARKDLRHILAAFNASAELSSDAVNDLAGWLYEPEAHPAM